MNKIIIGVMANMKTFIIEWIPLIAGFYLFFLGTMITTRTIVQGIIYNFLPITFGICLLLPFVAKQF